MVVHTRDPPLIESDLRDIDRTPCITTAILPLLAAIRGEAAGVGASHDLRDLRAAHTTLYTLDPTLRLEHRRDAAGAKP